MTYSNIRPFWWHLMASTLICTGLMMAHEAAASKIACKYQRDRVALNQERIR